MLLQGDRPSSLFSEVWRVAMPLHEWLFYLIGRLPQRQAAPLLFLNSFQIIFNVHDFDSD